MRFQQVSIFFLLAACHPSPPAAPPASSESPGAKLYNEYCVMCHLDGRDAPSAPPLVGSAVLRSGPEAALRVLLHGSAQQSALKPGFMPPQKFFTDAEAAAITAYIRSAFAGINEPVPPELAAQIRAEGKP
jgi:mono/diheme cytochrome c family protein